MLHYNYLFTVHNDTYIWTKVNFGSPGSPTDSASSEGERVLLVGGSTRLRSILNKILTLFIVITIPL